MQEEILRSIREDRGGGGMVGWTEKKETGQECTDECAALQRLASLIFYEAPTLIKLSPRGFIEDLHRSCMDHIALVSPSIFVHEWRRSFASLCRHEDRGNCVRGTCYDFSKRFFSFFKFCSHHRWRNVTIYIYIRKVKLFHLNFVL